MGIWRDREESKKTISKRRVEREVRSIYSQRKIQYRSKDFFPEGDIARKRDK